MEDSRSYEHNNENCIEFLRNQQIATATFCQPKYISIIRKLAEARPNDVSIVKENVDGSIVAHFPTNFIRITPKREISEEQHAILSERAKRNFHSECTDDTDESEDEYYD